MRRFLAAVILCAVFASACGAVDGNPADVGTDNRRLASLVADTGDQTLVTHGPASSTTSTTRPASHPLTNRPIASDELLLMLPTEDDLGALAADFILDDGYLEENGDVVRGAVQDREDEAADIASYGRLIGARSVFRPRMLRYGGTQVASINASVALFDTEIGASGYLADMAADVAKGIGAASPTHLEVLGQRPFAIDPIGEEAVAFTLDQGPVGEGLHSQSETVIAFRIGRMLAVTGISHPPDGDFRVRAIELTSTLEDRVMGVLRGTIRPAEPIVEPVQAPLISYAFDFDQLIDNGGTVVRVSTQGVVVGKDRSCDVQLTVGNGSTTRRYTSIGERVWSGSGANGALIETPPTNAVVATDLLYCPGWAIPLTASGLDRAIKWAEATPVEVDGVPTSQYHLGRPELIAAGFLPAGSALTVDFFTVNTSLDGPWILNLELNLSGRGSAFHEVFGDGFGPKDRSTTKLSYRLRVSRVNDPNLMVTAPG